MSCQEVLSMLSAYIDGEVQNSDARMIEQHLSECDSCAAECRALRATTSMLQATPEAEPPAFLLAQIEAATVNRTGFITRLQSAFDHIPTAVRWATAPVAAAVVLLSILLSSTGDVQTPVAVKPTTERIERATTGGPTLPDLVVEERSAAPVLRVAKSVPRPSTWKVRGGAPVADSHESRNDAVAPVNKPVENGDNGFAKPQKEETVSSEAVKEEVVVVAEPAMEEPRFEVVAKVPEPTDSSSSAKLPEPEPVKKNVIGVESNAIDDLRDRLAARSRGKYNSREDRIEGKKHSVGLVSLRF